MAEPRDEARKGWIARWIERRFGGYRHAFNQPDPSQPHALQEPRRVAVVGAGLAGLGAAAKLAERGFSVTLIERNDYLGGKVGAWQTTMPGGREIGMTHGFHAFFRHYYNLNEFFAGVGIDRHYRSVGDYMILTRDGQRYSFAGVATTPLLNLLSLARKGVYRLREVSGRQTRTQMEALLRYDPERTFAEWDEVSYAQFAAAAQLPASLALVFNTFSRAFFSDAEKMSMAELIKSFHFYYLSNDGGLIYDLLDEDYEIALIRPLRDYLERHGVEIHTGRAVETVALDAQGRFELDGEPFEYLVIASDVVGTRALFQASPALAAAAPRCAAGVASLTPGQRYSVWRLWLDADCDPEGMPGFVITERDRVLDALTFVHINEGESARWVAERRAAGGRGCVLELHCYAVPEDIAGGAIDDAAEAALRAAFMDELRTFFPALVDAEVLHEDFYIRRDFPAFHVGQHASRPSWDTELPNLFLAGDWVKLPFPAMLMEASYSAGLLAANAIFAAEGLREEPVFCVPPRGFLAGVGERGK
ncbi:FAD-dependent oxidoreductase [Pseudenhygromyxa sp. WMMC2535]|uniref:FAD-dependent oxidoreductase n=1 Tax=Pseudenhygromyxa sp. WMMC2535 TaxID=2712867 RepID=UPI001554CE85|nr:FAD-dependent oxidoreductase [Pseudenhygromyxa sp. WMMC2535]NVB37340.1 FAD-dependent oxidoreductase [Pseudenhygromyxa sp. WMMC2535]